MNEAKTIDNLDWIACAKRRFQSRHYAYACRIM